MDIFLREEKLVDRYTWKF